MSDHRVPLNAAGSGATRVSQLDSFRLESEFSSIILDQIYEVMRAAPLSTRQAVNVRHPQGLATERRFVACVEHEKRLVRAID